MKQWGGRVASASDPPIFSEHLKSLLDRDDMAWFRTVGLPRVMRCWLSGSRWKYMEYIPSLKLTACTWKSPLGKGDSYWKTSFLGAMLVSGNIIDTYLQIEKVYHLLSTVKGGFTINLMWLWCIIMCINIYMYIYSALLRFLLDDHLSSQRRSSWPNRWPKNTVVYLARIFTINDTFNASRNILKQSTARWYCW